MLTEEMLAANAALSGLTPEQKAAIVAMSRRDEESVIGPRISEIYNGMDRTIEKALGIKRNGDEKTYLYLERAAGEFAQKYADYDAIKGEVESLKAQVAEGTGGKELAAKLELKEKELSDAKARYAELDAKYRKAGEDHRKEMDSFRVSSVIDAARASLKVRADYNADAAKVLIDSAVAKMLKYSPSFEDGKLVFHGEGGAPMNNPANNLQPYTASELLEHELSQFGILETARPSTGAGGKQETPKGSGRIQAATRVEAVEAIEKELLQRGLYRGSDEFEAEKSRLWDENKVDELPLQ